KLQWEESIVFTTHLDDQLLVKEIDEESDNGFLEELELEEEEL
ncbi:8674_t:CDS:1, partial [Gigaspora rosea]